MNDGIDTKQATFNTASLTVGRINECLRACNYFYASERYEDWLRWTNILYSEVYPKLDAKEVEDGTSVRNQAFEKLNRYMREPKSNRRHSEFVGQVGVFNLWVRRALESHGLLIPDKQNLGGVITNL